MFLAFLLTMSGDLERGSWSKNMSPIQKELCVGETLFFHEECRTIITNINDALHPEKFCDGAPRPVNASFFFYPDNERAGMFAQLIKSLLGKKGSFVLLGVGYWDGCNANKTITSYIDPGIRIISDFYESQSLSSERVRWPQVVFVLPMLQGLLKSPEHFFLQDNPKIHQFSDKMLKFGKENSVPVFDFRHLAKEVHSFDGTHYGLGVNLMKVQILLNYLELLK